MKRNSNISNNVDKGGFTKNAKGEPRGNLPNISFLGKFPKAKKMGNTGRIIA